MEHLFYSSELNFQTVALLDRKSFSRLESAVEDINNDSTLHLIINIPDKTYFISDSDTLLFSKEVVKSRHKQEILSTNHSELKLWMH